MARRNEPNNTPKQSKESTQSAKMIEQYSRSLDNSANALLEASRNFEEVVKDLNKGFDRYNQDQEDNFTEAGKRADQALEGYSRNQKSYTAALVTSLKSVTDYAVNKLMSASTTIIDNYNQSYSKITAQMNLSAEQYRRELNYATDSFRGATQEFAYDLRNQFSQVDYVEALQNVLDTGIRGQDARDMAYRNLITNKLVPSIQTNTRTYTRYSKIFGDKFTEGITALTKFTQDHYGAEGLDEGGLESFMNTIGTHMTASAAMRGLSPEDAMKEQQQIVAKYQQLSATYGQDTALYIFDELRDYMSGNITTTNSLAAGQSGILPGDYSSITADALNQFAEHFVGNATDLVMATGNLGAVSGVGYDTNHMSNMIVSQYYGDKYEDSTKLLAEKFDAQAVYNKELGKLEDGYYQTVTDQMNKWNENLVADISTLAAESIPDTNNLLRLIFGVASTFFTAWMAKSAKEAFTGGSGGGLGGSGGSLVTSLGKGGKLTGLGTATSALSIVAGLAMMGSYGYEGYQGAIANGATNGQAWGNAGLSALSGGASTHGWSTDAKLSEAEERAGNLWNLDWGAVGKQAAAGAAVGAGTGALIGGVASSPLAGLGAGPGALIGGAVGAISGAASSAITQWVEMHDYQEYVESDFYKTSEMLAEMREETEDYVNTILEVNSLEESTSKLRDALFSKESKLKGEELAQISAQLAVEEALLEIKRQELGLHGETADVLKQAKSSYEESAALKKAEAAAAAMYKENGWNDDTDYTEVATAQTFEDLGLQALIDAGIIGYVDDGNGGIDKAKTAAGFLQMRAGDVSSYVSGWQEGQSVGEDYHDDIETSKFNMSVYDDAVSKANDNTIDAINTYKSTADSLARLAGSYTNDDIEDKFKEMQQTAKDYYTAQMYMIQASGKEWKGPVAEGYELGDLFTGLDETGISTYKNKVAKEGSLGSGKHNYYKLGTDRLSSDGLIYAHSGEAVLTAHTASMLREMSSGHGGIAGFVSDLYGASSAQVSAVPQSTSSLSVEPIVSAIREQTMILNMILSNVMQISRSPAGATPVKVNEKLLSYAGV